MNKRSIKRNSREECLFCKSKYTILRLIYYREHTCIMNLKEIAEYTNYSVQSVAKHVNKLIELGFLTEKSVKIPGKGKGRFIYITKRGKMLYRIFTDVGEKI